MTNIRFRASTIADFHSMLEIEIAAATLFPTSVLPEDVGRSGSPEEIRAAIGADLAWVADAEQDGVVGFLVGETVGTAMHIVEMDVLPSHGRRGIGGLLLEHSVAQARAMGLHEITLTTFQNIPWNAPFYAKHGFKVVCSVNHYPHLDRALRREAALGLAERIAMYRNVA
ncbi:MAG: GNAT family N-acetyltransferase [Arenimonas sp.]|uniref:GNAT family N-acetyltransferase n=1 Tax=Arenimonas sp. TaxID=1872635 RepID=UPI0025C0B786|nr:GNAT family N-acetyltransferase [Arenimonas sp.]MBW8368882.1 GNAT family N-acetyltransferase [Arenimonas sp.]